MGDNIFIRTNTRVCWRTCRSVTPLLLLVGALALLFITSFDLSPVNNVITVHTTRALCSHDIDDKTHFNMDIILQEVGEFFDPWITLRFTDHRVIANTSLCHVTYKIANAMARYFLVSGKSIQLLVSNTIEEHWVAGFALLGHSFAFVSADVEQPQDLVLTIAHEIGHLLSLSHPFYKEFSELARADYMSDCPQGSGHSNIMDYLPARCGGIRSFTEGQLIQMKNHVRRRKSIVLFTFICSIAGVAVCVYECCRSIVSYTTRRSMAKIIRSSKRNVDVVSELV